MENNKEILLKLENYLERDIYAEDLAKRIRRFKMETIRMILEMDNTESVRMDWINDGFYFLTQLCEILDPYLEE